MIVDPDMQDGFDEQELVHDFPVFKSANFYGLLGELVKMATEHSEADPVAVYFQAITGFAAFVGNRKHFYIGETRHETRFFTAIVGNSSRARKGTSFPPIQTALKKVEEVCHKRSTNLIKETLTIRHGGLSSAEGLIYAVRDESDEKRGKDMQPLWDAVTDKRMLIVEGELGSVFKVCQREGSTLSPLLRVAYDGGTLSPMTKNNRITATDPHINVIGHITAYELRALLDESDLYNGLVNRFLWCCARRTKIISRPLRMDESRLFELAIKLAGNILKAESLGDEIEMDGDATLLWDQVYRSISNESDTGPLGAATSRNEAHVRRVSALLAIIDGTNTVTKAHLLAAKAIADYSAESCRFLFTVPSTDAPDAQKLLTALANGAMTQTAISKLFNNHKSRQELIKLLGDLQSLNRIKKIKTPGSKTIHWQIV